MKICPIAIAMGCSKCAIFKICPAKGIIGDYVEPSAKPSAETPKKAKEPAKVP